MLPGILTEPESSFAGQQPLSFKQTLHRYKSSPASAGLTAVSVQMQAIENQCGSIFSVKEIRSEFNAMLKNIRTAGPVIENERYN